MIVNVYTEPYGGNITTSVSVYEPKIPTHSLSPNPSTWILTALPETDIKSIDMVEFDGLPDDVILWTYEYDIDLHIDSGISGVDIGDTSGGEWKVSAGIVYDVAIAGDITATIYEDVVVSGDTATFNVRDSIYDVYKDTTFIRFTEESTFTVGETLLIDSLSIGVVVSKGTVAAPEHKFIKEVKSCNGYWLKVYSTSGFVNFYDTSIGCTELKFPDVYGKWIMASTVIDIPLANVYPEEGPIRIMVFWYTSTGWVVYTNATGVDTGGTPTGTILPAYSGYWTKRI